jgi:hypothetical protein
MLYRLLGGIMFSLIQIATLLVRLERLNGDQRLLVAIDELSALGKQLEEE